MKKIMFNDKMGLTQAVLELRKTQTRRILHCPKTFGGKYVSGFRICTNKEGSKFSYLVDEDEHEIEGSVNILSAYRVGEEVAVAQSYYDIEQEFINHKIHEYPFSEFPFGEAPINAAGWKNKMFTKAMFLPHRIKITNIRVERLQDISKEDCLKEGIEFAKGGYYTNYNKDNNSRTWIGNTPKEAFASLIDKVSGKGTWESNPWVFVYDFELVK